MTLPRLSKPMIVAIIGALTLALGATAGSLTPPGAVGSTMHSLANIYDTIASATFDSSGIVANQNGSLLGNLKYIENQIAWASSSGNIWNLNSGNVGIGTTAPQTKFEVVGTASVSNVLASAGSITSASYGFSGYPDMGMLRVGTTLLLQNKGTVPSSAGRSRLSLGEEFFSLFAARSEDPAQSGALQCFDQGGPVPICTFSVTDGTNLSTTNFYPTYTSFDHGVSISATLEVGNGGLWANGTNVGIGTTNPTAKLAVVGTASVSGNILVKATTPVQIASLSSGNNVTDIMVVGNYAYVPTAFTPFLITIYDITNPASPSAVARISDCMSGSSNTLGHLWATNRLLAVQCSGSGQNSIRLYDVSKPANPKYLSSILPGGFAWQPYISGKYLYASLDFGGGIVAYDISNPKNPVLVKNFSAVTGRPLGIAVQGRYLYNVEFDSSRFNIYDVEDLGNMYRVGSASLPAGSGPHGVNVFGRYAYIGGNAGVRIYDISNPASPSYVSTAAAVPASFTTRSWVAGKYLYASMQSGFYVFDISDIRNPFQVGVVSYSAGGYPAVQVSGKYAYVAAGTVGFKIFDVAGIETPGISGGSLAFLSGDIGDILSVGRLDVKTGTDIWGSLNVFAGSNIYASSSVGSVLRLSQALSAGGNLLEMWASNSRAFNFQASTSGNVNLTLKSPLANGNDGKFTLRSAGVSDRFDILNGAGTNLFSIASGGNVGIGIVNPIYAFLVNRSAGAATIVASGSTNGNFAGTSANGSTGLYLTSYRTTANTHAELYAQAARGTASSPLSLLSGDDILYLNATGYTGSAFSGVVGQITFEAARDFSPTSNPTNILFSTTASGTTSLLERMRIDSQGNVGIGSQAPDATLRVIGSAEFGDVVASSAFGKLTVGLDSGTNDRQIALIGPGGGIDIYRQRSSWPCCGIFVSDITTYVNSPAEKFNQTHPTADIGFYTDAGWAGTGVAPTAIRFLTGTSGASGLNERMRITSGGNVGINIPDPNGTGSQVDSLFEIRGSASFTTQNIASISGTTLTTGAALMLTVPPSTSYSGAAFLVKDTNGALWASLSSGGRLALRRDIFAHGSNLSCTTAGSGCIDYAESYPTTDSSLSAGEVVAVDPHNPAGVIRAEGSASVLGIISTNPATLITGTAVLSGTNALQNPSGTVPVALAGRVPVKLKGSVSAGDRLSLSDTPGVAQKATTAGMTIGIALEDSSGPTVLTFVNTSFWAPAIPTLPDAPVSDSLFSAILAWFKSILGIEFGQGSVKVQQLCVGSVCVTEEQFMKVFGSGSGGASTAPTASATITPGPSIAPTSSTSATVTPTTTPSSTPTPTPTATPDATPSAVPTPTATPPADTSTPTP